MERNPSSRFVLHLGILIFSRSLCGAADFIISVTTYPADGTLSNQPSHTSVSDYGNKPRVLLNGNADNG